MMKGIKLFFVIAIFSVLLVLTVCDILFAQTTASSVNPAIGETISQYILGKGDTVSIVVRNQPEFSGDFIIGPDGRIQYNSAGDITAEGLTKEELKTSLEQTLERYVKGTDVTVIIKIYNSKFVYLLGELGRPGKYPMKGNSVSLREAIMAAGLPRATAALRRVYVITPNENRPTYVKVDIYKLLYKGILKQDIILSPGDLVVVPSTVPSEINRALTNLLSPFTKAASVDSLLNGL